MYIKRRTTLGTKVKNQKIINDNSFIINAAIGE